MTNIVRWIGFVVACSCFAPSASAGLILDSYFFSGVTTDASAQAVTGSIYFYGDTPAVSTTPTSTIYGPDRLDFLQAAVVVGGKTASYFANSYDANDFLSVQHGPGVPDVFRFDIAGFQLTLSSSSGLVFGDTSLSFGDSLGRSLFDTATIQATVNNAAYNINVTQFGSPVPEPASILMLGVAGVVGLGWSGRRTSRPDRA